jgi:hypothetical protein
MTIPLLLLGLGSVEVLHQLWYPKCGRSKCDSSPFTVLNAAVYVVPSPT